MHNCLSVLPKKHRFCQTSFAVNIRYICKKRFHYCLHLCGSQQHAHCALSASPCTSNFMIRQFLSLGTPPHYTTLFTTIGRLLAPAQLLSSQLPLSELYLPDSRFASRPLGLGSLYFSLLGEES